MATGEVVTFNGGRHEVCGRCARRYRATGTFQTTWELMRKSPERLTVERLHRRGWPNARIQAALPQVPLRTIQSWVAQAQEKLQDSPGPNRRAETTAGSR